MKRIRLRRLWRNPKPPWSPRNKTTSSNSIIRRKVRRKMVKIRQRRRGWNQFWVLTNHSTSNQASATKTRAQSQVCLRASSSNRTKNNKSNKKSWSMSLWNQVRDLVWSCRTRASSGPRKRSSTTYLKKTQKTIRKTHLRVTASIFCWAMIQTTLLNPFLWLLLDKLVKPSAYSINQSEHHWKSRRGSEKPWTRKGT